MIHARQRRRWLNRFGLPYANSYEPANCRLRYFQLAGDWPARADERGGCGAWDELARGPVAGLRLARRVVLVLEQTNYPAFMPGETQVQNFDASFAFPNTSHPVVSDLMPSDLRWWADDHRLVTCVLPCPREATSAPWRWSVPRAGWNMRGAGIPDLRRRHSLLAMAPDRAVRH